MRRTETRSQRALCLEGDTPKCLAFEPRPFVISLVFGSSLSSRTETLSHTLALLPHVLRARVASSHSCPGFCPPCTTLPSGTWEEAVVHGAQTRWFKQQKHSLPISKSDPRVAGGRLWHPQASLPASGTCWHHSYLPWPPVSRVSSSCKGASHWTESPLISRMIALQEPYLIVLGETFFPRKVTR